MWSHKSFCFVHVLGRVHFLNFLLRLKMSHHEHWVHPHRCFYPHLGKNASRGFLTVTLNKKYIISELNAIVGFCEWICRSIHSDFWDKNLSEMDKAQRFLIVYREKIVLQIPGKLSCQIELICISMRNREENNLFIGIIFSRWCHQTLPFISNNWVMNNFSNLSWW